MKNSIISSLLILFSTFAFSSENHSDLVLVAETSKVIENPVETLRNAIGKILVQSNENQENEPQVFYDLMTEQVDILFDLEFMSRFVMARYYRKATGDEKIRFAQEFKRKLVMLLLDYYTSSEDIDIRYQTPIYKKDNTEVFVKTIVNFQKEGSKSLEVNYMMKLIGDKWKIRVVTIEGINLIITYRHEFTSGFKREGISGLIEFFKNLNDKIQESYFKN